METVFMAELERVSGIDHGMHILAVGSSDYEAGIMEPSSFVLGWLNTERCNDGTCMGMTSFHPVNAKHIVLHDILFDTSVVDSWRNVRIGIVAFEHKDRPGFHGTAAVIVMYKLSEWKRQWTQFRTIPDGGFVSQVLMFMMPAVEMWTSRKPQLVFEHNSADALETWIVEKEAGTAHFPPNQDTFIPLFHDDDGQVYLDLGSGNGTSAANLPPALVRGGVLTGTSGCGKFSALLSIAARVGVSKPIEDPKCLPARGTLYIVPVAAVQWRMRQIRSHYPPSAKIVEMSTHAQFEQLTWHDVMTADVVLTTEFIFHSKWYSRHGYVFMSNMHKNPDTAVRLLEAMRKTPPPVPSKSKGGRKRVRREIVVAEEEEEPMSAETETFFNQGIMNAARLPIAGRVDMLDSVSYQLSRVPCGWERVLRRPILEAIQFQRVICTDVQYYSQRQMGVIASLPCPVKWITDSCMSSTWMDKTQRWDAILPTPIRRVKNLNGKRSILRDVSAMMQPRDVSYTSVQDRVDRTLLDNLKADASEGFITPETVCSTLHKCLICLPPQDVVLAVIVEEERRLLAQNTLFNDTDSDDSSVSSDSSSSDSSDSESSYVCEDDDGEVFEVTGDDSQLVVTGNVIPGGGPSSQVVVTIRIQEVVRTVTTSATAPSSLTPALHPPRSDHVESQMALVNRLEVSLATEIGKDLCRICVMDVCNGLLSCGHAFCFRCLNDWMESDVYTCPVCMREFRLDPPFFVPLAFQALPLPTFCVPSDACSWTEEVCHPRLSSAAFWCLTTIRRAEKHTRPLVFLVESPADMKTLHTVLNNWRDTKGIWPTMSYNGAAVTRLRKESKFINRQIHIIMNMKDIIAGCRLDDVTEILSFCPNLTKNNEEAIALRMCIPGDTLVIRSCVYSDAARILGST